MEEMNPWMYVAVPTCVPPSLARIGSPRPVGTLYRPADRIAARIARMARSTETGRHCTG